MIDRAASLALHIPDRASTSPTQKTPSTMHLHAFRLRDYCSYFGTQLERSPRDRTISRKLATLGYSPLQITPDPRCRVGVIGFVVRRNHFLQKQKPPREAGVEEVSIVENFSRPMRRKSAIPARWRHGASLSAARLPLTQTLRQTGKA